jgi:hypothetical protein
MHNEKLHSYRNQTKETETGGMVMKTWQAVTRCGWEDYFI